jgi:hypothetical protein
MHHASDLGLRQYIRRAGAGHQEVSKRAQTIVIKVLRHSCFLEFEPGSGGLVYSMSLALLRRLGLHL